MSEPEPFLDREVLAEYAKNHRPPQAWFDEDDDPFGDDEIVGPFDTIEELMDSLNERDRKKKP